MAGVEKIQFKLLDDAEHLALVSIISPALESITVEECQASVGFHRDILQSRGVLDAAMGRIRKSELTESKKEDDSVRDGDMAYIEGAVELYLKKGSGPLFEAAVLLDKIITTAFAGVNINNNTQQSEGILRFESAMNAPDAQDAAKLLRVNSEVESVISANRLWMEKDAEQATIKESDDSPRLQPSREELRRDIRAFVHFYDYKIRKGSEFHKTVATQINGQIGELMAKARTRATLAESQAL